LSPATIGEEDEMARLLDTYTTRKRAGTADRCRIETDHPHPLGNVKINWLDDGHVRIRFKNAPEVHLTKAYLDGHGRAHILEIVPAPRA